MKSVPKKVKASVRRAYKLSRLGGNLVSGGLFIKACYQFPKLSGIDGLSLNDYRLFKLWVSDLAHSMNTDIHVTGQVMSESGLFVSNHISWLDTIVLNDILPLSFIARHDLADWPLLGTFTSRMESVFIDRSNKFQAYRSIPAIEEKLNEGYSVHLFPESTTSDGQSVLPFYNMFYEAVLRVRRPVQPVVIRYSDGNGVFLPEPAYINDDTFFDTLGRILGVKRVHAHVHFCEPISVQDAQGMGRKALCQTSRGVIANKLTDLVCK